MKRHSQSLLRRASVPTSVGMYRVRHHEESWGLQGRSNRLSNIDVPGHNRAVDRSTNDRVVQVGLSNFQCRGFLSNLRFRLLNCGTIRAHLCGYRIVNSFRLIQLLAIYSLPLQAYGSIVIELVLLQSSLILYKVRFRCGERACLSRFSFTMSHTNFSEQLDFLRKGSEENRFASATAIEGEADTMVVRLKGFLEDGCHLLLVFHNQDSHNQMVLSPDEAEVERKSLFYFPVTASYTTMRATGFPFSSCSGV
jgi:hypothetical protein